MTEERNEIYLEEIVNAYPGGQDYAMYRLIIKVLSDEARDAFPQGGDNEFKTWPSDPRAMLNDRLAGFEEWIDGPTRWVDPLGWVIATDVLNYIRSGGLGIPC